MSEIAPAQRRSRLSERSEQPLAPFVRATSITTASVYWLPVSHFPLGFRQREWVLDFVTRFSSLWQQRGLLEETFLQLKHTREALNRRFTQTLMEYEPTTGVLLAPGSALPPAPTSQEIKKLVDAPDEKAEIRIEHLVPDYVVWFLQKKGSAQRQDFFGVGGMILLWVHPDEEAGPEQLPISKALATHPAMQGRDLDAQFKKLHSMQAPWLRQSKRVFGEALKEDAMFPGVPFVLPKLDASIFTGAKPDELSAWFGVFPAWCIESETDGGLLLAAIEPDFDESLQRILEDLRQERGEYPL